MVIQQHGAIGNKARAITALILFAAAPPAFAADVRASGLAPDAASFWSFGVAFTFLFVTIGPLNVIGPFTAMTNGQNVAFKRRLALKSFFISVIALVVAATIGAVTLKAWGVSVGALLLAAGAILFLVALRPVLAGYNSPSPQASTTLPSSESELAFWPLAFPTIVTPYGLALLILLFALHPLGSGGWQIPAAAGIVLTLDLAAMLCADRIAKIPFSKAGLDMLGAVMGVLLVALGVQATADGLRLLTQQTL